MNLFLEKPQKGGERIAYLATSDEVKKFQENISTKQKNERLTSPLKRVKQQKNYGKLRKNSLVFRHKESFMSTNGKAISTKGLTKRYSEEVLAVDSIDLSIPTNTIYALLGPNGAGKTTTISMLTTLIEPTSGSAQVAGLDVVQQADQVRQRIGVTFQEIVLDPDLTGRESLDFHARLYGIGKAERLAKIDELLKLVELEEAADRRTNTYSGGMKRRLELARGIDHQSRSSFFR